MYWYIVRGLVCLEEWFYVTWLWLLLRLFKVDFFLDFKKIFRGVGGGEGGGGVLKLHASWQCCALDHERSKTWGKIQLFSYWMLLHVYHRLEKKIYVEHEYADREAIL